MASWISRVRLDVMTTTGGSGRGDRAEFRNRDLEIGEQFQQVRFEGLVGAVELVDEKYRSAHRSRVQGAQERPFDEVATREDVFFHRLDRCAALIVSRKLGQADANHLPRIVPLVHGGSDVQSFVALQPHEAPPQHPRENPPHFRLSYPRFAFEKERTAHPQGEKHRGSETPFCDVVALGESVQRLADRCG